MKAYSRGKHAGVYDPGTAYEWKTIVRNEAKAVWDGVQFSGPVGLSLWFAFPRPANHSGKKGMKEWAPSKHSGRPDADNLAKAVMDALTNLGVWKDDSQVSSLSVCKRYSDTTRTGCTVIIKDDTE